MLTRGIRALAPLSVLVLIAGCAGDGEPEATETVYETLTASPEPAPTKTVTATPEPSATVTETVTASPEPEGTEEPASGEGDLTERIREVAGDMVREVIKTSEDGYEVSTLIIDPRGDDGSPEAQEAIAICQAVESEFDATHVSVMESDDTTFAWFDSDAGECVEY